MMMKYDERRKNMKKKLVIFIAAILCMLFATSGVSASTDVDNAKYIPKVITTDNGYKMMFDSELARIARKMSSDSYGIAIDSNVQDISKTFQAEGFVDIKQSHLFDEPFMGAFSNNFLVGVKTFEVDGVEKHVLAIAFRGTQVKDGFDYADLFTDASVLGLNGFHSGFYAAALKAYDTLYDMEFPSLKNEDGSSMTFSDYLTHSGVVGSDYSILVTGHSLGGAVANIFAGDIISQFGKSNVMCYTFASPIVCSPTKAKEYDAYNIFNIINTNDIVPNVGYNLFAGVRLGTDLKVSVTDSEESAHSLSVTYEKATNKVINSIDSLYPYIYRKSYTTIENDEEIIKDDIYILTNCTLDARRFPNHLPVSKLYIRNTVVLNTDITVDGDIIHPSNAVLDINGYSVICNGNYNNDGLLKMTSDNSYLLVGGNYTQTDRSYAQSTYLTAGTLEIKGNMDAPMYRPSGTHVTVLSGDRAQNVDLYFYSLMYETQIGYFNIIELRNTSEEGITFADVTYVHTEIFSNNGVLNNTYNIYLTNNAKICGEVWKHNITLYSWVAYEEKIFNGDVHIKGEVVFNQGQILNGNVVIEGKWQINDRTTVNSDLIIDGSVVLNADITVSGNLSLSGEFNLNSNKAIIYNNFTNNGILKMQNDSDYLLVFGDYTHTYKYAPSSYLIAGILEIKGNMVSTNYKPKGTHTTLLSGDNMQNIDLYSYTLLDGVEAGWFNILEIANTSEEGINFIDKVDIIIDIYQPYGTQILNSSFVKLQDKTAFVDYGDLNSQINAYNGNANNVIPTWLDYERYCKFVLEGDKAFTLNESVTDTSFTCDLYFSNDYSKSSAVVIIAFYDSDNQFVQMASKPVEVKAGKIDVTIDYESKPYSKYKIMVWENFDNIKPLMTAK